MTAALLKEVNVLITRLSREEKEIAFRKLGALLGQAPTIVKAEERGLDWLLKGIADEISRRGHKCTIGALTTIGKDRMGAVVAMQDALLKLCTGEPTPPAFQFALGKLAGKSLASYLDRRTIPVGPKTMLERIERISLAIDDDYPGYLESGLLHALVGGMGTDGH